jgi:magnesium-transporting ATPase (P-type)
VFVFTYRIVLFTGLVILLVTLAAVYVFAEFSEELPRRLRDRQVNSQKCRRLLRRVKMLGERLVFLEEVRWGCLQVGDFVVLRKGEGCPAELLVVHCRSAIVKINPEGEENPEIPYKNRLNIQ